MDKQLLVTSQHILRDIILLVAFMILIPTISHLLAEVIAPSPRFEDFSCQYKNMHCREVDKVISDLVHQRDLLKLSPTTTTIEQQKIASLNEEILTMQRELGAVRSARDQAFAEARKKAMFPQFLIKALLAIAALVAGFFIGTFPLQAGLIVGGIIGLLFVSLESWGALNNLMKLLLLLVALGVVIAISIGGHRRFSRERNT